MKGSRQNGTAGATGQRFRLRQVSFGHCLTRKNDWTLRIELWALLERTSALVGRQVLHNQRAYVGRTSFRIPVKICRANESKIFSGFHLSIAGMRRGEELENGAVRCIFHL